jgi:hypothetical protein
MGCGSRVRCSRGKEYRKKEGRVKVKGGGELGGGDLKLDGRRREGGR